MSPQRLFGGVVVGLLLSLGLVALVLRQAPPTGAPAEVFAHRPATLAPLWPAPPFAYVSHLGETVTRETLAGRPWVANFIFTQCRTICPLLTTKMVQLQRQVPGLAVRFISFSVDPDHDTPEVLDAYRKRWSASEPRWTLLATDKATLPATAAGFHVTAAPAPAGELDAVIHSGVFVLVDAQGTVRGVYDTEEGDGFGELLRDVRRLAAPASGAPASPASAPKTGIELYHELSCFACHERPELAPAIDGISGRRRELVTGALVVADAAYVRRSILWPNVDLVRGYPLKMPTYAGLIDDDGLDALVEYVLSRPALPALDGGEGTDVVALDPVCGMRFRVTADTPRLDVDGGTIFFCAGICRDAYQLSIRRHAGPASSPVD